MRDHDKLVYSLRKAVYSRVVSPVIVESRASKFNDIRMLLENLIDDRVPEFLQLQREKERVEIELFSRKRLLKRFNMVATVLPRPAIFDLAEEPNVERVYADKLVHAFEIPVIDKVDVLSKKINKSTRDVATTSAIKKLVGADVANDKGFNGSNVKVAVLDTGVDRVHPQTHGMKFDSVTVQHRDENGHGTWCSTAIAGKKAVDALTARENKRDAYCEGIAPGCQLTGIKCLGFYIGTGTASQIIKAIELALRGDADVISMSLGSPSEGAPGDDPFNSVINRINSAIFVAAAGNEGPEPGTISSPGCFDKVLTVGAYNQFDGSIADFSSRGPTEWGVLKPDCIAPGVNIISGTTAICDKSDGKRDFYAPLSGTSMATPIVAGLVALMVQCHRSTLGRSLNLEEIKDMLVTLGHEKNNTYGYGPLSWKMYEEWLATEHGVALDG